MLAYRHQISVKITKGGVGLSIALGYSIFQNGPNINEKDSHGMSCRKQIAKVSLLRDGTSPFYYFPYLPVVVGEG